MKRIEASECAAVGGGRSGGGDVPTTTLPLDHYPFPTCPVSRPPPES